jgi:hypothetical protein
VPPGSLVETEWLALERRISELDGRMIVGGRSSGALPAKVRARARVCASMSELAAYATGWLEGAEHAKSKGGRAS